MFSRFKFSNDLNTEMYCIYIHVTNINNLLIGEKNLKWNFISYSVKKSNIL